MPLLVVSVRERDFAVGPEPYDLYMFTLPKLPSDLKDLTGRGGLALLSLVLFADVYSKVALQRPLLDALPAWNLTPAAVVFVLVGYGLFRPISRVAAVAIRFTAFGVLSGLPGFVANALGKVFGLDDYEAERKRHLLFENLMERALVSDCGPALQVYNELAREDRNRRDIADHCLGFLVMAVASAWVGAHSIAAFAWTKLASAIHPGMAAGLMVVATWALLRWGIPAPVGSTVEFDASKALSKPPPSEAAAAVPLRRAGD